MKKINILLFFTICMCHFVSTQTIDWAINSRNNNNISSSVIAVDENDNMYGVGTFKGTLSIDSESLTSTSSTTNDGYVVKFGNDSKTPVWLKAIKGSGNNVTGNCVTTDHEGNVYVVGEFTASLTIDETTLTSSGSDIYLIKLSSSGTVLAAKTFGYGAVPTVSAVAVDDNDDVYIAGYFENSITFGEETDAIETLGKNAFLAKFDNNLSYQWETYAASSSVSNSSKGTSLAFDENNIFMIGSLVGTVTYSGYETALSSRTNAEGNSFLAKFNKDNGSCLWAKVFGGTGSSNDTSVKDEINGINVKNGIIGLACSIRSLEVTLDGVETTFYHKYESATNGDNALALFLSTDGNYHSHYVFGDPGGNSGGSAYAVYIDKHGNAFVGGHCSGSFVFGPFTPSGIAGADMFVTKINLTTNAFEFAYRFGGGFSELLRSIVLNKQETFFYMHGHIQNRSSTVKPNMEMTGSGTPYLLDFGSGIQTANNPYWAKYNLPLGPISDVQTNSISNSIFYNSSNQTLELRLNVDYELIEIVNLTGQEIYQKKLSSKNESISLTNFPKGIYITLLKKQGSNLVQKICIN